MALDALKQEEQGGWIKKDCPNKVYSEDQPMIEDEEGMFGEMTEEQMKKIMDTLKSQQK